MIGKLLCWLGLHRWYFFGKSDGYHRRGSHKRCSRCGECWLYKGIGYGYPGYTGQE